MLCIEWVSHTVSHQQLLMEKATNKSFLWDYYEKLPLPNGGAKCLTCKKEIAITSGNTTGLARHLESQHNQLYKVWP